VHYFPSQTEAFLNYFKAPEETPGIKTQPSTTYTSNISYEQAIIDSAKNVSPSVVSIVISKNVPTYEQQYVNPFGDNSPFDFVIPQPVQNGTQLQEVGAGSGFIVSADGLVLTNKHVVSDNKAEYTVYTSDGKKYTAKVLALDPVQDLAVIKIESPSTGSGQAFQPVTLGDSTGIQLGQTAIAIGNALGQFSNTVSVGIVSGLQRTISASDQIGSVSETLEGIIQTDAAINSGNSGGPLVNLKGEVIGINTAMAQGAQSIGFAIPINAAKKDISQVASNSKIVYPFLGVKYTLSDNGALVSAVTSGSAAAKAGLKEKDVILEINGEKISTSDSMATIIQKYNAGDKVTLKISRDGKEQSVDVTLGERSS
jgi:S1-C subfamily serine protease